MGRKPCCAKEGLNRGAWSAREDMILTDYINTHGEGKWRDLPAKAGLKRCGKSCRLRWLNYLRPDIKRGNNTKEEEDLIIKLHNLLGNRWSLIAGRLPGRTDNEIKNYWNTTLSKKIQDGESKAATKVKPKKTSSNDSNNSQKHEAIRTKAVRCTKVIIPKGLEDPTVENALMKYDHSPCSSSTPLDEDESWPLMDFDISEFLMSNTVDLHHVLDDVYHDHHNDGHAHVRADVMDYCSCDDDHQSPCMKDVHDDVNDGKDDDGDDDDDGLMMMHDMCSSRDEALDFKALESFLNLEDESFDI